MGVMGIADVVDRIQDMYGTRIPPRLLSNLFYDEVLRRDLCPVKSGRRLIPESYFDEIVKVLRSRGKLPQSSHNLAS